MKKEYKGIKIEIRETSIRDVLSNSLLDELFGKGADAKKVGETSGQ